jgi:hypothetical protein
MMSDNERSALFLLIAASASAIAAALTLYHVLDLTGVF